MINAVFDKFLALPEISLVTPRRAPTKTPPGGLGVATMGVVRAGVHRGRMVPSRVPVGRVWVPVEGARRSAGGVVGGDGTDLTPCCRIDGGGSVLKTQRNRRVVDGVECSLKLKYS